jgi:hypothetical protein
MPEQDSVAKVEALDPSIFVVETTTSVNDRTSLLRLQKLLRSYNAEFNYLEIGSYLSGTLLPFLLDPKCKTIISIDLRASTQRDERAQLFVYHGKTTAEMIETLRPHIPLAALGKMLTFDADASEIPPRRVGAPIDLALIDGEHTTVAVFRDFLSILPMLGPDAVVAFHDFNLIFDAVANIDSFLTYSGISHRMYLLPDVVAVIVMGKSIFRADEAFAGVALEPATFVKEARRLLHEHIARSVAAGLHRA